MNEIKLTIHPFETGAEKESANKVQEEANEAVHAWRSLVEDEYPTSIAEKMNASIHRHIRLADKIANTIQASCNLAERYGIDLQAAMWRCERRNRSRRRYQMEDENAKTVGTCGRDVCDCGGDCGNVPLGVGDLPKSPEEMSADELFEMLSQVLDFGFSCEKLTDAWCKTNECISCKRNLFSLLKAAIAREEIAEKQRQIADLTHERDGLKRRLEELNDAGIASLHRLLREAVGEAKNITDAARHYVENARESRKPDLEREAVIERLRKLDFTQKNVSVYEIACVVLGYEPAPWWNRENSAKLRDKLIELIGEGDAE